MNPRGSKSKAFTLIEIMIVVCLLGFVVAMGMPSMIAILQKEGMRKAVADVVEACSHARANAILSGSPSQLTFDLVEGTFSVQSGTRAEPSSLDTGEGTAFMGKPFSSQLPEGVGIELLGVNFVELQEAESATVRFYPNGTSDEFTILLRSENNEWRQITLDVITALADVKAVQ